MAAGEFEWIHRHLTPLAAGAPESLDLTDDAALLKPPGGTQLVVAADAVVAGVHFLPDDPPETIGRKALRTNLSDLAAMGARPWRHVMTLALPPGLSEEWFAAFARGLAEDQDRFGSLLIGGDLTATPGPLMVSVTVLGLLDGEALRRSGARVGDDLWVTGTIGDAALGLKCLQDPGSMTDVEIAHRESLIARYRIPTPRTAFGREIASMATACIDVSDGLPADAQHVAEASGVRMRIDADAAPFSEAALSWLQGADDGRRARAALLTGGDDYELLFTAPPIHRAPLGEAGERRGLSVTRIGEVTAGEGLDIVGDIDFAGRAMGWRHF